MRVLKVVLGVALLAVVVVHGDEKSFVPVTDKMLQNPSPDDWLMYSRTYDAQRFSPLKQINKSNVIQLRQVFVKEFGSGVQESIPIVYRGVMYVQLPGAGIQALNAATGDLVWEYKGASGASRAKALSIYDDMVYYTGPQNTIVALDARTGAVRWEAKT